MARSFPHRRYRGHRAGQKLGLGIALALACAGCARKRPAPPRPVARHLSQQAPQSPLTAANAVEVRCPAGYVEATVVAALDDVVLLANPEHDRIVPIRIGDSEALSIRLRLSHRTFPRPLTHDLLDSMLRRLGGRVESVRVERLDEGVFIATVVVVDHGRHLDFDARACDAIALALGNHAPIFMSRAVIERAGHRPDQLFGHDDDAGDDSGAPRNAIAL